MDEADQMLDIGFERAINLILATMPKQRRTGLFSATLNENVLRYLRIIFLNLQTARRFIYKLLIILILALLLRLKKAGLRNPHSISIKEKNRENLSTPNELRLRYCVLEPRSKLSFLINFLRTNRKSKIVVYFLTCNQVDYFHAVLRQFLDVAVIKVS